jgi:hypothetical protein
MTTPDPAAPNPSNGQLPPPQAAYPPPYQQPVYPPPVQPVYQKPASSITGNPWLLTLWIVGGAGLFLGLVISLASSSSYQVSVLGAILREVGALSLVGALVISALKHGK